MDLTNLKIQDIPAEEIKQTLIDCNLDDVFDNLVDIGDSTFEFLFNAGSHAVADDQFINAFVPLMHHFKFYRQLLTSKRNNV